MVNFTENFLRGSEKAEIQETKLINRIYRHLEIREFPEFRLGDVVTGVNLPSDLDFAYCRRLLVNLDVGSYDNLCSGKDAVRLAIKNIALTLKPGGWFIAVEESSFLWFSEPIGPLLEGRVPENLGPYTTMFTQTMDNQSALNKAPL